MKWQISKTNFVFEYSEANLNMKFAIPFNRTCGYAAEHPQVDFVAFGYVSRHLESFAALQSATSTSPNSSVTFIQQADLQLPMPPTPAITFFISALLSLPCIFARLIFFVSIF
jgi:hypothetical protein